MIVVVTAVVVTAVIVVAATSVAIVVVVRAVIVRDVAAIAVPVTCEVLSAIVMRRNPASSFIGRPSPIARMPYVTTTHRIPVAIHPGEFGSGSFRDYANHTRWRRRPDSDAQRNLRGAQRRYPGEQHDGQERTSDKNFHRVTPLSLSSDTLIISRAGMLTVR